MISKPKEWKKYYNYNKKEEERNGWLRKANKILESRISKVAKWGFMKASVLWSETHKSVWSKQGKETRLYTREKTIRNT